MRRDPMSRPPTFMCKKEAGQGRQFFPQPSYSLTTVRFGRELCWLIETDRLRADPGPIVAARWSADSYNAPS
jgi:hypothetical protein